MNVKLLKVVEEEVFVDVGVPVLVPVQSNMKPEKQC
jgi:hypothetical protein